MLFDEIRDSLASIRRLGLYPTVRVVEGISNEPEIIIEGKRKLLFCSGNYLGLANHPEIINAVKLGLDKYGLHPAGSRLISGTLDVHVELEQRIAEFKLGQAAMVFTTGTMANIGIIPGLINIPDLDVYTTVKHFILKKNKSTIFSDELNHATIIDGCRLANADIVVYKHRDVSDLEKKLHRSHSSGKLIVTDGVFSMDGDIAPLPEIINLAKQYNAELMVDDAHGTGVLGANGRGTLEHFGLTEGVDIQMGTFSKAFGVLGGFIVSERPVIDFLRLFARTYMFTGAFFGSLAAGVLKSIDIVNNDINRREKLWWNTEYFRSGLKRIGFDTLNSETPIVPIFIGEESLSISIADELFEKGILAPCTSWPSVHKKKSRIRFALMATHTKSHIDYLLTVLENIKHSYKV